MNTPTPQAQALLAEQTEALTLYLEALFADKPASLPVPVAAPGVAVPAGRVIDLPATRVLAEVAAPVVEVAAPPVTAVVTPAPAADAQVATQPVTAGDEPRPDWAAEPFPCLLLKVQGLALALPLVKLNRIQPWSQPTPIPGYVPWLLGMLPLDGLDRRLKVVDTVGLIMPERQGSAEGGQPPQHIVMIGDGEWGLTCEDVSSVITIDPAKVRWRTSRTKRPWLAGTVIEHLCALLDAERLAEMLSAGAPGLPT
jgi:purine-binding chemotaxis protein CheW